MAEASREPTPRGVGLVSISSHVFNLQNYEYLPEEDMKLNT